MDFKVELIIIDGSKIEYKDKEYFYFNIMYILYNCINVREG